ncbi:NAD(P)/FAD-dependent oxidoreductase [Flavitalea sp. BT771]|uniref:FAD-dependent oxidoreductase n=1 Tax=Flavitalea sp. BT771 TaxID=3063329 RepID=UPI0026E3F210|nr:NAD(P)/FAD-dependent oxidoreductase [Flavitalea sp. BT771]MDO6432964.1 NAD(P)/FAD-dependent oxidoreductase [Flavitalea sp. BT771]MDV6221760.1 NAD(P)/FAD-dependent oxidoreductase [Flavitalea sp. BT771]
MIHNKKIAIIGGGPGGLTLARLLQLKGVDVKVYERDVHKEVRIQGGALDLHTDSGLAALAKAGLMNEFKIHYRPGAEKMRVVDKVARIYFDDHAKESPATQFGDKGHRPEIDRGPLRDILLNSLRADTVVWDSHIMSLEAVAGAWKLVFQNGNSVMADMVIGADGANSKIRPFVTDIKPFWTGVTLLEGSIHDAEKTAPVIHRLLKGGKIFAFGDEKTLIVSSKGNGSFGFATGCKTDENWFRDSGVDFSNHLSVLAWFKKEFSDWAPVWHELFASETTIFIPRPQYCMPLDQKWVPQSNITLIGDAAHWMPPYAGEGVNMAMLDALELSKTLTDGGFAETRAAIGYYEKRMFKRFAKVGRGTMFNMRWMHGPKALDCMMGMFGGNWLKKGLFMGKMWVNITLSPLMRRAFK